MILVDSSAWIDHFKGAFTTQSEQLDRLLTSEPLAIGDLTLAEVLQGCRTDPEFHRFRKLLSSLTAVDLGGQQVAIKAAQNFRTLREKGITVRKTIDLIIATRCIESNYNLLHNDRDFDPFIKYLGLRSVV